MGRDEFWEHQSSLPGLRAVIDPNDRRGWKSAYLDSLHKAALSRHVPFGRTDHVLDFGCGIGRIVRWLAPRVATVHGVDGYLPMLRRAHDDVAAEGIANVVLCAYDGTRLPLRTATFDRITCVWVLQHIVDDVELAVVLAELARVTRPGGCLAFIERISDERQEPWMPAGTIARRPPGRYPTLFAQAGLRTTVADPICDDGPIWHRGLIDRLVLRGRLPSRVFPAIARIDLRIRRLRTVGGWSDHVFVCRRD